MPLLIINNKEINISITRNYKIFYKELWEFIRYVISKTKLSNRKDIND